MDKLLTFALCIAVIFMLIGLMPVHGEEAIYDEVIRLHVIANSDTAEDQAQKLAVRDAVLAYTESILSAVHSRDEAIGVLKEHSDEIQAVAIEALRKCGSSDGVYVELGTETYPTREYAACAFPSGDYLSLRIVIGDGVGKNWWCVLFPTLCLSAAEGDTVVMESSLAQLGLSGDQYRIITDSDNTTYQVRFKILEVFEEIVK